MLLEDSLDGGPPSVGSGDIPAPIGVVAGSTMSTPISSKKVQNCSFVFNHCNAKLQ